MAQRKIAVLGGGPGALAAVFQLTEEENWKSKYDITVYQLGWRLGGKGASGRGAERGEIEEHGLHIWFGFYHNAFRMIRKVYQDAAPLMPDSPFQSWEDAFSRQTRATLMEFVGGVWKPWPIDTPLRPGLPGDPSVFEAGGNPPAPWDYVKMLLDFIRDCHQKVADSLPATVHPETVTKLNRFAESLPAFFEEIVEPFLSRFALLSPGHLLELARRTAERIEPVATEGASAIYNVLLHLLQSFLDHWIQPSPTLDEELRRLDITFDTAIAVIRGLIASGAIFKGFDAINDIDYAAWLKLHGARYADSALIRNLYDGCFAYLDGDSARPNFEAGTALRGQLQIFFGYRGAIAWRMNAGMGDTVFAPLYLLLKNRGVKFRFFRRVKKLYLSPDRKTIDRITLDIQANLAVKEYYPLVTIKALPCWPNAPKYEQLKDANQLRQANLESWYTDWHDKIGEEVLVRDDQFHDVVLGIPLGALPYVCDELIAASPAWRNMLQNVKTVPTQALQLWLHKPAADLGWENGAALPPEKRALACGYVEPFDTYADMTHLLPREDWLPQDNVQSIAYFCNALRQEGVQPPPFTDPNFPAAQLKRVRDLSEQFLNRDLKVLWPKAGTGANPGGVDPALVRKSFLKANIDPPERYVLSAVGSSQYRLDPGDSGFTNLYLAGDWTRTSLNGGCVEAAVMSGMAAAASISKREASIFSFAPRSPSGFASAAVTQSSSDIRKFWKEQAEAKLPPESQVVARNAAITAAYSQFYVDQPGLYKWSGLASHASHRVGLLLLAFDFVPQQETYVILEHATGHKVAPDLAHDLDLIRRMNNDVYADIAWALMAYRSRGLNEVLSGLESSPNHEAMMRGFSRIDKGSRMLSDSLAAREGADLIWDGNQDLLDHEQREVLQPGYNDMQLTFEEVLSVVTSLDFNVTILKYDPKLFTSFTAFMVIRGLLVLLRTGLLPRIANFDQRWYWISKSVFRIWKGVDARRPSGTLNSQQAALLREGERSDLMSSGVLWPVDKRPK
jgi:uncharacterized protein with NAD-binding domain and iron-sulfur cluster